jgi:hypothetical protein
MKAVVDHIVAETHEGLEERSPSLGGFAQAAS